MRGSGRDGRSLYGPVAAEAGQKARSSEGEMKFTRGDPAGSVKVTGSGFGEDGKDHGREARRSQPVQQTNALLAELVKP